jgi:hypothetical protein
MVATIGKLGATAAAARMSGSGWMEAARLGVLMNVRGLMDCRWSLVVSRWS